MSKEESKVPRLDELDALAAELNDEYKVYVNITKTYYEFGNPETMFVVMLTGNNKLGREVKEKVEKFFGVKLKAKKEILKEGMIEFRYDIPDKFILRLDKAMTCKKVGTEMREVEYKVEVSPGKDAVMEMKKKMVEVAKYRCAEAGVEFRGDAE